MPYYTKEKWLIPKRKPAYHPPRGKQVVKIGKPDLTVPEPELRERYLDPEMAERERKAREEIERKKSCIAPAYNKGAYQYISSEEQAKDVGR